MQRKDDRCHGFDTKCMTISTPLSKWQTDLEQDDMSKLSHSFSTLIMSNYMFKYIWNLRDSVFTKDKGKVFSCFACGGGSTMGYKLA